MSGLKQHNLLWFGLGEKAGSRGEGRGCGEPREELAQLDFSSNSDSDSQNGGVKSDLNLAGTLTRSGSPGTKRSQW